MTKDQLEAIRQRHADVAALRGVRLPLTAKMHEDIGALLEEVERLTRENDALRKQVPAVDEWRNWNGL